MLSTEQLQVHRVIPTVEASMAEKRLIAYTLPISSARVLAEQIYSNSESTVCWINPDLVRIMQRCGVFDEQMQTDIVLDAYQACCVVMESQCVTWAFVRKVVYNKTVSLIRLQAEGARKLKTIYLNEISHFPDKYQCIEDAILESQETSWMLSLLEELDPVYRAIILLRFHYELKPSDIIKILLPQLGITGNELVRTSNREKVIANQQEMPEILALLHNISQFMLRDESILLDTLSPNAADIFYKRLETIFARAKDYLARLAVREEVGTAELLTNSLSPLQALVDLNTIYDISVKEILFYYYTLKNTSPLLVYPQKVIDLLELYTKSLGNREVNESAIYYSMACAKKETIQKLAIELLPFEVAWQKLSESGMTVGQLGRHVMHKKPYKISDTLRPYLSVLEHYFTLINPLPSDSNLKTFDKNVQKRVKKFQQQSAAVNSLQVESSVLHSTHRQYHRAKKPSAQTDSSQVLPQPVYA